jgi:hypothetical protein
MIWLSSSASETTRSQRAASSSAWYGDQGGIAGVGAFLAYQKVSIGQPAASEAEASCRVADSAETPRSVQALLRERAAWAHAVAGDERAAQESLDRPCSWRRRRPRPAVRCAASAQLILGGRVVTVFWGTLYARQTRSPRWKTESAFGEVRVIVDRTLERPSNDGDRGVIAEVGESLTDIDIVTGFRRDPERFTDVHDRYFRDIYRYVAGRLDVQVAEDITAETFCLAFGQRDRFDPERGSLRAWLFGIATNLVAQHRRKEARRYKALARAGADLPRSPPANATSCSSSRWPS